MEEKELREVNLEELETKVLDFTFTYRERRKVKILYDYDMGLSILDAEDTEDCVFGINGPSFKGSSNYCNLEQYHDALTVAIELLKTGSFNSNTFYSSINAAIHPDGLSNTGGSLGPSCSFN